MAGPATAARARVVPPGTFAPGGESPRMGARAARAIIPLEWIKRHPATRRWWAKSVRNAPVGFTRDLAFTVPDGFEGIIEKLMISGGINDAGVNPGGFMVFLNGVGAWEGIWNTGTGAAVASSTPTSQFDILPGGLDAGASASWLDILMPLDPQMRVEAAMAAGPNVMWWAMWGLYWPLGLASEWLERGWRK